jgi:beta-glucosidase
MVREELKAARAQGLIAGIKDNAVNDQEFGRMFVNSVLDERSMRESDLLPFEIALRNSDMGAVMCSYNKINGIYGCENQHLRSDVLKKEFGFKGFVISDWGATHSPVPAALAGTDMEMPGDDFLGTALKYAVERGDVRLISPPRAQTAVLPHCSGRLYPGAGQMSPIRIQDHEPWRHGQSGYLPGATRSASLVVLGWG